MLPLLNKFFRKIPKEITEFNNNNPLGMGGERVDFIYDEKFDYFKLDMYQKNHFRRYEFAVKNISNEDICGDFACGAGYGSVMLSYIASKVIGADLNKKVISEIKKRYRNNNRVEFINRNLLNIDFQGCFSSIISFETIEHFTESDIYKLLSLFNNSLKKNGKIILSTPYLQEESEAAHQLGFHKTFNIDEDRIKLWLSNTNFENELFYYQDYKDHEITHLKNAPDFLICVASKA